MTTKKLGNLLVKSSIIGAMSLTYAGCGIQAQKQTKESAAENSIDLKKDPTERASLALSLPTNLPAAVDELEVTLSRLSKPLYWGAAASKPSAPSIDQIDSPKTNGVNDPVFTQIFQIKGQAIQINDLEAGDYWITVKLIESNSGRIYSHGEGQATVQAGKDATVHISMTKVDATTGGLVIVLDAAGVPTPEPLPAPMPLPGDLLSGAQIMPLPGDLLSGAQICPLIGAAPVCVVVGKSLVYQVYDHKRLPNSCKFAPLPQFVQQVPNSFCKGLPGSGGLLPSQPIGL